MHRLDTFGVNDLVVCSRAFKEATAGTATLEEAAGSITSYLYDNLVDAEGDRACVLARFYKTHRLDMLDEASADFARTVSSEELVDETRCLTLLASRGVEAEWNDRRLSAGHRAIPLVSTESIERSPMISSLLRQLGIDVVDVVAPDEVDTLDLHHRDYDVFFVPDAVGDPLVPAQDDFVIPYGIHSVVGCGGVLPSRDLFALILFTTMHLQQQTADLFRTVALSAKTSIVPHTFRVFTSA